MGRGFPSMTALLGLLAVAGYQNRDKLGELLGGSSGSMGAADASLQGSSPGIGGGGLGGASGGLGGLLGGLSGMLGGGTRSASMGSGGIGGLLSGGIGELAERFKQNGHGDTADSWIGNGPNREVSPNDLEHAIGPDVMADLSQRTGLSHEELLSRLSRELPHAVDKYTPDGKVPAA